MIQLEEDNLVKKTVQVPPGYKLVLIFPPEYLHRRIHLANTENIISYMDYLLLCINSDSLVVLVPEIKNIGEVQAIIVPKDDIETNL